MYIPNRNRNRSFRLSLSLVTVTCCCHLLLSLSLSLSLVTVFCLPGCLRCGARYRCRCRCARCCLNRIDIESGCSCCCCCCYCCFFCCLLTVASASARHFVLYAVFCFVSSCVACCRTYTIIFDRRWNHALTFLLLPSFLTTWMNVYVLSSSSSSLYNIKLCIWSYTDV
jgi:hypothetical protein